MRVAAAIADAAPWGGPPRSMTVVVPVTIRAEAERVAIPMTWLPGWVVVSFPLLECRLAIGLLSRAVLTAADDASVSSCGAADASCCQSCFSVTVDVFVMWRARASLRPCLDSLPRDYFCY